MIYYFLVDELIKILSFRITQKLIENNRRDFFKN